jgi:hypothetical protein
LTLEPALQARLQFLLRVVQKESRYLLETDARLFADLFVATPIDRIESDSLLAERVEAFVSRFGRLQDTLADKLLPALLDALAEPKGASLENLDRAEKLGWLDSADQWLAMRKLRNQMVHEYIEDLAILASALRSGHTFVPALVETAQRLTQRAQQRLIA